MPAAYIRPRIVPGPTSHPRKTRNSWGIEQHTQEDLALVAGK